MGNILTKTTYQGSTTRYLYNAANRLVQLSNPDYLQVDYQYDPAGRLLSRVTSAGARTAFEYDANGALTRLTQYDAANALISDTNYTRDRLGNILTQSEAAGLTAYVYDALYRLKSADYPGTANDEAFAYDKVGNRKLYTKGSLVPGAATRYYTYATGTNRLADIRIGSATGTIESVFTHDFEGRLSGQTGVGAKTLSWDAKGRLNSLGTETYNYDPMDYRIGRSGGGLGNRSYFLEGEHLESEYSGTNLLGKYFRGSSTDELVAGYLNDTDGKLKPFLFHHDALTSTTAVTGHSGGAIQRLQYAAFGATQSSTGTSPSRLKYTGREDDGTGLYYYRARYYDAAIGRFVSEDPMGFAAGDVNFYTYVGNNPVNGNDPTGLAGVTKSIVGVGIELLSAFRTVGHHTVPREVLKMLPSEVANNPLVRGAKGAPNIWDIPENLHKSIHQGAGGGAYNEAFKARVAKYGDNITAENVVGIRNDLAKQFGIDKYAPSAGGSTLREVGSVIAGVIAFGLEVLDAIDPFRIGDAGGPGDMLPQRNTGGATGSWGPSGATGSWDSSSAAGGGFLLYPNKPNTNMMRSVYSK